MESEEITFEFAPGAVVNDEEMYRILGSAGHLPFPTLADPFLTEVAQEVESNSDYNAEEEQKKLHDFLTGVGQCKLVTDENGLQTSGQDIPVSTGGYSLIKCVNCNSLFDSSTFQNHSCNYDLNKLLEHPPVQDKPTVSIEIPPKKTCSDRVITENQIRLRRYLKDEFKHDLSSGETRIKKSKGPNECNICERKFVHPSGLSRHMEKHALDLIPAQISSSVNGLTVAHGLRVVLQCIHCGRVFCEIQTALDHILVHFPKQSPVPIANSNFKADEENIEQNVLDQILNEGEGLLASLAYGADSELHQTDTSNFCFVNLIVSSVLQCEFCEYIFTDISHLLVHSACHLPERRFECTACDIQMTTSKEASTHFQTDCVFMREGAKHLQISLHRYFVCNVCELKFTSTELLQEHRHTCYHYFPRLSKSRMRLLLPCEFCEAFFEYSHEIQPHYEEKHLNKKKRDKDLRSNATGVAGRLRQYLCDICGKSYTQSSHLWQHLRFHQGKYYEEKIVKPAHPCMPGVKPFVCQEDGCGRKFTIRPDLNDHIRKCHTGERPYHCLVCGKRFLTGSVFYQHRLIHRGERRYECEQCGKRFYRADALKNHQRIHTGEKPYSCLFCTKTFRQRGDRDKHIRARHSHLDDNTRLIMQIQKFQLEAQAAAEQAKKVQESSMAFPLLPQDQNNYGLAVNEIGPDSFIEASNVILPQFVQLPNGEVQNVVHQNSDLPIMQLNDQVSVQSEMTSNSDNTISVEDRNCEKAKVVVVDNNGPKPFFF